MFLFQKVRSDITYVPEKGDRQEPTENYAVIVNFFPDKKVKSICLRTAYPTSVPLGILKQINSLLPSDHWYLQVIDNRIEIGRRHEFLSFFDFPDTATLVLSSMPDPASFAKQYDANQTILTALVLVNTEIATIESPLHDFLKGLLASGNITTETEEQYRHLMQKVENDLKEPTRRRDDLRTRLSDIPNLFLGDIAITFRVMGEYPECYNPGPRLFESSPVPRKEWETIITGIRHSFADRPNTKKKVE